MNILNQYNINIYEKWLLIKDVYIQNKDNKLISKLFEYYTCIKLSEEYKKIFFEYSDIDPDFREINQMSQIDTGIDCCDLTNTIVQCKLRLTSLNWRELGTFFGSQVIYDEETKSKYIRWHNLLIVRNLDSKLSSHLAHKSNLYVDKTYDMKEFVEYCNNLIDNPPEYPVIQKINYKPRDYQIECIDKIKKSTDNLIINLPTGTGKNFIIVNSLEPKKKYLILVPRIILMEQIYSEISKLKPEFIKQVQFIGDGENNFDNKKSITICVYNSVEKINSFDSFDKIFIDEAHHIFKPEIYWNDDDSIDSDLDSDYSEDLDEFDDSDDFNSDNSDDEETKCSEDSDIEELETEDEVNDKDNYIKKIRQLTKLNNNIYLSATIDKKDGFDYYSKDIRDMIELGYLSDYTINIPIFDEDPTNKNICWHLIRNYSHIIIYCNSQKEGIAINKLMNQLVSGCSEYIDCKTPKKSRNKILDKFKSGKLLFLVNVKILVEGFDAPITKGVCFMHLPSSKTTLVQIIGRALRLHPEKQLANIILPCSTLDDGSSICDFLKVMAQSDSRIRKSYQSKKLGGYIGIDLGDLNEINIGLTDAKYELVYDSMGNLKNNVEIWMKRLDEIKKYIDENNKRPSTIDKDKAIKQLGGWLSHQQKNYKNKKYIMKEESIQILWKDFINSEKYKKYFEDNKTQWIKTLNEIKKYIDENNKRPSCFDKNITIKKLGKWLSHQQQNYKKNVQTIKEDSIVIFWEEFLSDEKYKKYFVDNTTLWFNKLKEVKKYIDENNKIPSGHNKDNNIKKLGNWLLKQKTNYKNNLRTMKKDIVRKYWENFISDVKYKEYFEDNETQWIIILNEVKKYIDENNKRPSETNKDINIKKLGQWISYQQGSYKKLSNIMKEENIRKLWEDFITDIKYKNHFEDNKNKWIYILREVKKYIDINNLKPSKTDEDNNIKILGKWIETQQTNYKNKKDIMKDNGIRKLWEDFVSDDKYKEYFKYFDYNKNKWMITLNMLKMNINQNNKRPSCSDKNENIKKLGNWIKIQNRNYKNNQQIMKEEDIRKLWEEFISDNKYKQYFSKDEDDESEEKPKVNKSTKHLK
jgi:superfamily II DNA or RNA helicase